jgi:hypothetical protein
MSIAVHIIDTEEQIVVSHLDCVVARFDRSWLRSEAEFVCGLEDLLRGLGFVVSLD